MVHEYPSSPRIRTTGRSHAGNLALAGRRIDICAPPFAGHLYPLIPLGRSLAEAGADVRFVTGTTKCNLLSALGFRVAPLFAGREKEVAAYSDPHSPVRLNPKQQLRLLKIGLRLLVAEKEQLRSLWAEDRPDLVIEDWICVLPAVLCQELGIPFITSLPSPFAIESRTGTPSFLGGWAESSNRAGRIRDALGRIAVRSAKRVAFRLCVAETCALGFQSPYRADGSDVLLSPYSIVGLGVMELEFARDWPPHFRMIGPVLETPEAAQGVRLRWPDSRPRILVSAGTHLPWIKHELVASAQTLLDAFPEYLFCFSLGNADQLAADPIDTGLNWAVYQYVPYSSELDQFEAVIHHAGAGVTYACLAAGKPSLVVPRDFDQFDFARRIEAKGLGLMVRSLSSDRAVSALRDVLNSRRQAPLAEMSSIVARYRPDEAIVAEVSRVLAEHASAR